MRNIPDFVLQVQEVERNLQAEWQLAQEDWKDHIAERFNNGVIEPYSKNFQQYITGDGLKGYGVDQLMQQMDKHLHDMSALTGISEDVAFVCAAGPQHNGRVNNWSDDEIDVENLDMVKDRGGVVHNDNQDRDYWREHCDGAKPGELRDNDIQEIFKNK